MGYFEGFVIVQSWSFKFKMIYPYTVYSLFGHKMACLEDFSEVASKFHWKHVGEVQMDWSEQAVTR